MTDVQPGSPAEEAGLTSSDYILATSEILFTDIDTFETLIKANENQIVQLWVFNVESKQMRKLALAPRRWRGVGVLGCEVHMGVKH